MKAPNNLRTGCLFALVLLLCFTGCTPARPQETQIAAEVESLLLSGDNPLRDCQRYSYEVVSQEKTDNFCVMELIVTEEEQYTAAKLKVQQRWRRYQDTWILQFSEITDTLIRVLQGPTADEALQTVLKAMDKSDKWNVSIDEIDWEDGRDVCTVYTTETREYPACVVTVPKTYTLCWDMDSKVWKCESYEASSTAPMVYDFTRLNGKWIDPYHNENVLVISGAPILKAMPNEAFPDFTTRIEYSLLHWLTNSSPYYSDFSGAGDFKWKVKRDDWTFIAECETSTFAGFFLSEDGIRISDNFLHETTLIKAS